MPDADAQERTGPHRNEQLGRAMEAAGLSVAELADRLGITPRAVQNWLAGERTPRRDERLRAALLLGVTRTELWPGTDDTHQLGAVAEWPNIPAVPKEVWRQRFGNAQDGVDICAGSSQFLAETIPDLGELLRAKTSLGHRTRIRIVFSDPDGQAAADRDRRETSHPDNPLDPGGHLAALRIGLRLWTKILEGVEGAELRILDHPDIYSRGLFRFDDVLYEYPYVGDQRGAQFRSVVEWHHVEPRGRFTDLMDHIEFCWEHGTPYTG